ncbi:MAG: hypothetical protein JSW06_10980, partial [Thermoplasmatales archaeon]
MNKKLLIWYKNTYIINDYTGKPNYTKNKGDKPYDDSSLTLDVYWDKKKHERYSDKVFEDQLSEFWSWAV